MLRPPRASMRFTKPIRLMTTAPSTWSPRYWPMAPSSASKPRAKSLPVYGYAEGRSTASRHRALRRFGYGKQWHGNAFSDSGGSGTFSRLRGMPYMTERPEAISTSSRIIVSVRRLQRPTPSSTPTSRTLSFPSAAHSVGGVFGPLTFSTAKMGMPSPVVGPGVGSSIGEPAGLGLGEPRTPGEPLEPGETDAVANGETSGASVAPG